LLGGATPLIEHELYSLLTALDGVRQSAAYHPEGDALYHSLQVFERALADTRDPILLAAALLHDVGKSIDGPTHDAEGASLLDGLVDSEVCWLVAHHLDLLKHPQSTRKHLRRDQLRLQRLEKLRRYDLAGRDPHARVNAPEWALNTMLAELCTDHPPNTMSATTRDEGSDE
jgi:HD superfamily phosphodiesterase